MNLKNNFLLKNCWSGPIKKISILIFTIYNLPGDLQFTWRYYYFIAVYQQSSWFDLQFLRYRVWQAEIGNYRSFFALYPPPLKTQKIRILKKWKTLLEISSFYTNISITTIIWGTVPEIWSETDSIFCYFGPFFAFIPP